MDSIGACQKCPLYGEIHFIESPSKNKQSSKVNMKSTMTFQGQIYWKDQKAERLKKMQSFFRSKVFNQGLLH